MESQNTQELTPEQIRNAVLDISETILSHSDHFTRLSAFGDQSYIGVLTKNLQALRTGKFAKIVTKLIEICTNRRYFTSPADFSREMRGLQDELLAIDLQNESAQAPNRLKNNPIIGELVSSVSIEINRRVASVVDEYLELKGIGGPEIQNRLAEAEQLKARIQELEKDLEGKSELQNELSETKKQLQDKGRLIIELYAQLDRLVIEIESLRKKNQVNTGGKETLSDNERQITAILHSPAAILGIPTQEIIDLRKKDPNDFEQKLRRKAQVTIHPDKFHAFLENCPDPSVKMHFEKTITLRFQLLETAIEEVLTQFRNDGKLTNSWKYRKI